MVLMQLVNLFLKLLVASTTHNSGTESVFCDLFSKHKISIQIFFKNSYETETPETIFSDKDAVDFDEGFINEKI